MRITTSLLSWALLGLLAFCASAGPAPSRKAEVKYVPFSELKISFTYNAAKAGDQPTEVQLHVSKDRGNTWETAQKTTPEAKRFIFRAPKDGEYWFMPRTKYQSGNYLPAGPPQAEAKVVVDTTQPVLNLEAISGEGGDVHVRWDLSDANLAAETFKIEYQMAGAGQGWQKVAVDPLSPPEPGAPLSGEIHFVPQGRPHYGEVTVRAEVADRAGNRAVVERPVVPQDKASLGDDKIAGGPPGESTARGSNEATAGPQLGPDDGQLASPPEMAESFPGNLPAAGSRFPVAEAETPYPRTGTPDWPATQSRQNETPPALQHQTQTVRDQVRPPVSDRYPEESDHAPAVTSEEISPPNAVLPSSASQVLPPGVRPHMVNKLRFELLYDVESVGAAGIAQVELWGTRDGGQAWSSFGVDEDCRSPMMVKVDGEGIYGFRVVVTTGAGVEGATPASGDLPDVWVGVDQTKPAANLVSAEQGSGEEVGELTISWEAADERLAARPISLRMSESPDGPWHAIASGLENTGRYLWHIDQRVPKKFYLRLEVRDEAGNIRIDDSTEPVEIERVRPQGRIRDVRPFGEANRRSRTTHNLLK